MTIHQEACILHTEGLQQQDFIWCPNSMPCWGTLVLFSRNKYRLRVYYLRLVSFDTVSAPYTLFHALTKCCRSLKACISTELCFLLNTDAAIIWENFNAFICLQNNKILYPSSFLERLRKTVSTCVSNADVSPSQMVGILLVVLEILGLNLSLKTSYPNWGYSLWLSSVPPGKWPG